MSEQVPSKEMLAQLRETDPRKEPATAQILMGRAADCIDQLQMPPAKVRELAHSEEGADSLALIRALSKQVEGQRKHIATLEKKLRAAHEPAGARFPRDNAGPNGWTISFPFLKQVLAAADSQPDPWDLSLEQVEAVLLALETVNGAEQPPSAPQAEVERMRKLFWLAKEDVIFFSGYDAKTDRWPDIDLFWSPAVNLNDTFSYVSADAQQLDDSEIDRLIAAHKRWGYDGVVAWASLMRKCEPIEPRRTVAYYAARSALTKPGEQS